MENGAEGSLKAAGGRPRECHRCPRNGKGDPYCWQVCAGPAEKSDKGRSFVRTGGLDAEAEFIEGNMDGEYGDGIAASRITTEEDFIAAAEGGTLDPDTLTEEQLLMAGGARPDAGEAGSGVTAELSDDVERALVPILANLFGDRCMTDVRLCIFRHIFRGDDLETTGRSLPVPISKQAVFKHLRCMVDANPVIAKVILQMKKAGHGGAHKRTTSQPSLFDFAGMEGA